MPTRSARMFAAALVSLLGATGCAGAAARADTPVRVTPSFLSGMEPAPTATGTPGASASAGSGRTGGTGPASSADGGAATGTAGRSPASAAGGACRRLTFERVRRVLGVDFQVAAAGGTAATSQTCVLQQVADPDSDLVLTVTPAAGVTAAAFAGSYVPSGGVPLDGVGKAAYRVVVRAPGSAGPRVEIGWLSRSGRILTLAHTLAAGEDGHHTTQVVERLAALATEVGR
ncbi:MAG: hypothetical protein QOC93_2749 [Actinomycetota bacterium]|jgi:hypothetical protein|nr:hypothetical protein [Actinomycetota bacterium]